MPKGVPSSLPRTGIYCIRNSITGKVYVGSAARSVVGRWNNHKHLLRLNRHRNKHLQAAWNKYGEAAFEFSLLEACNPDQCVLLEQQWITRLKAADREYGYNLSPTAGSNLGMKDSEETRYKKSRSIRLRGQTVKTLMGLSLAARRLAVERTILTREKKEEIRRRYVAVGHGIKGNPNSLGSLAKEFGVSSSRILQIVRTMD